MSIDLVVFCVRMVLPTLEQAHANEPAVNRLIDFNAVYAPIDERVFTPLRAVMFANNLTLVAGSR